MISGTALKKVKEKAGQLKRLSNLNIGLDGWTSGTEKDKKEKPTEPKASTVDNSLSVSPKVDMFKNIGRIPDAKLAEGLTSIGDTDSTGGLGNKVLNDQEAWLNNWYSQRSPKFGLPFKPAQPNDVVFRSNKGMGGELSMGYFDRAAKTIELNKDVPESQTHSTYLHEKNHMYQDATLGAEEHIRKNVWGALYKDYPFGGINSYSGNPDEVHSRLMQLRYEKQLDPNAIITPEMLKKISKEDRKRHNLDIPDEQLMELLNKVVSVQKKDTSNLA